MTVTEASIRSEVSLSFRPVAKLLPDLCRQLFNGHSIAPKKASSIAEDSDDQSLVFSRVPHFYRVQNFRQIRSNAVMRVEFLHPQDHRHYNEGYHDAGERGHVDPANGFRRVRAIADHPDYLDTAGNNVVIVFARQNNTARATNESKGRRPVLPS